MVAAKIFSLPASNPHRRKDIKDKDKIPSDYSPFPGDAPRPSENSLFNELIHGHSDAQAHEQELAADVAEQPPPPFGCTSSRFEDNRPGTDTAEQNHTNNAYFGGPFSSSISPNLALYIYNASCLGGH